MIATRRGLAISAAIAAVLAIILALDLARTTAPPSPFVIPDLDPASITELAWSGGSNSEHAVRDGSVRTGWKLLDPPGTANAETIDAVITALRGAHWQRRAKPEAAGATTAQLAVTLRDGGVHTIAIGQPLGGAEQQWLVADDAAVLVDAWVARALSPDPLKLRITEPFANAASAVRLEFAGPLGNAKFVGRPRRIALDSIELVIAAPLIEAFERALAGVVIVRVPRQRLGTEGTLLVRAGDVQVVAAGACPDDPKLIAADTSEGRGCIEPSAWAAVTSAVEALAQPSAKIAEPRPLPYEPAKLTLADRSVVDVVKLRIDDQPADPARVGELVAALGAPAQIVEPPKTPATGHIVASAGGVDTTLDLYGGGIVARHGEPVALRLGEGAYAILAREGPALRDLRIWLEEPSTISAIVLGDTTYERDRATGDWRRTGPGRDDRATLDQLALALANPHALGPRPSAGVLPRGSRRTVAIRAVPPAGGPRNHTLTLEHLPNACAADAGAGELLVAQELCTLSARLVPP